MNRDQFNNLQSWKESPYRKPLVVRGARQTGKTWLLKEFGKRAFKQLVYVNFAETPTLQALFKADFDIKRIIAALQIHSQIEVIPEETLIVFDEIQAADRGITSLQYFYENAPQYVKHNFRFYTPTKEISQNMLRHQPFPASGWFGKVFPANWLRRIGNLFMDCSVREPGLKTLKWLSNGW